MTTSINDLTDAINALMGCRNYEEVKQEIITLANTRHGRFSGGLYPLNALVDYARDSGGAEWLTPLFELSDATLYPDRLPVVTPEPTDRRSKENAYQASYMRATRMRQRKACLLRYSLFSPELKATMPNGLLGQARKDFLKQVRALWAERKAEILNGVTYAAERNELSRVFWQEIDHQLDAGLAGDDRAARQVLGVA